MFKGRSVERRVQRVERELRDIVAQYLIRGFKHELPGLVCVHRARVNRDLHSAQIFVGVLGDSGNAREVLETLNSYAFEVQKFVGQRLATRFCPKLKFLPDENLDKQLSLERKLASLSGDDRKDLE